jgi:hypothetical protein
MSGISSAIYGDLPAMPFVLGRLSSPPPYSESKRTPSSDGDDAEATSAIVTHIERSPSIWWRTDTASM